MSQVTDYNIANASGASVRSDLNAVFDAIKTLNSGGSDPANTEAFMPFVDTGDSNKLKIRNSSNNGFTTIGPVDTPNLGLLAATGGTMTGVLQLPVGSVAAPSINFGQTNTGFFKGSSHRVSFTSAGTQVFYADSTGININSSKELKWRDNDSSNFIAFRAPSNISDNLAFTLPDQDGSSGEALITNGSKILSFGSPTVGAANLTGNTLASGVTASSLTSVGTLSSLAVSGTCTATTFSGSGASLTDVPAEQLTGTVADARISSLTSSKLSGALPAIDGSALTGIAGSLRSIKSASDRTAREFNIHLGNFADHPNIQVTINKQSGSRVLVFCAFKLKAEQSGDDVSARLASTGSSLLPDIASLTVSTGSGSNQYSAYQFFAHDDHTSETGNTTYKLQATGTHSSAGQDSWSAYIDNAFIIAIEYIDF